MQQRLRRRRLLGPALAQQVGDCLRLALAGEDTLSIPDHPIRALHGGEVGEVPDMVTDDVLDAGEHVQVRGDQLLLELFAPLLGWQRICIPATASAPNSVITIGLSYRVALRRSSSSSLRSAAMRSPESTYQPKYRFRSMTSNTTCRCGARGCLEAYVGGWAIVARYDERRGRGPADTDTDLVAGMTAIAQAQASDQWAAQVLQETAMYLGAGIANLINLFNPERIVVGGWIDKILEDRLLPVIREVASRQALRMPFSVVSIVPAQLGRDAVALGAATLPVTQHVRPRLTFQPVLPIGSMLVLQPVRFFSPITFAG